MSKYFGKCFGPSAPAPKSSFWLRCPRFLLSKFASQLKLIQSVVRIRLLGTCVISSILRVLLSGFWVSESQFPSPRDLFPGSWVSGSQCPRVSGSRVLGLRVPSLRVLGSLVSGLRVPRPGSQVLILDYARKSFCESILPDLDNKVLLQQLLSSEDLFKIHYNLSNIKQQKHSKLKTFPET